MMNFSNPLTLTNEPAHTLYSYLEIELSEKCPYISFHEQTIQAVSPIKSEESKEKASNQFQLFNKIIGDLKNEKPLICYRLLDDELPINQKSTDSSFSDGEIFSAYLKSNAKKIQLEDRLKVVMSIIQRKIFPLANGNAIMEKFHREALANALNCHKSLYIDSRLPQQAPSLIVRHLDLSSINLHRIEEESNKLIKRIDIETMNTLISFWIGGCHEYSTTGQKPVYLSEYPKTSDSCAREGLPDNQRTKLKKERGFDSFENEKEIIEYYKSQDPGCISDILEESTCRAFFTLDLDALGRDIGRQMRYATIKNARKTLFAYEYENSKKFKKIKPDKIEPSVQFQNDLENFKRFVKTFIIHFTGNDSQSDFYISKIKELSKKQKKDSDGFESLCTAFMEWLKSPGKTEHETSTCLKLYHTLLTMTQKTYMLTAVQITQALSDLRLTWKQKENSHSLDYHVTHKKITLTSTAIAFKSLMDKKSSSDLRVADLEPEADFKLCVSNTVVLPINHPANTTCQIAIKVDLLTKNYASTVQEKIITPLRHIGFRVQLLDS